MMIISYSLEGCMSIYKYNNIRILKDISICESLKTYFPPVVGSEI